MPVKKKGLHRLIFGGVKEVLTNLKGKVVKRKDPPTRSRAALRGLNTQTPPQV